MKQWSLVERPYFLQWRQRVAEFDIYRLSLICQCENAFGPTIVDPTGAFFPRQFFRMRTSSVTLTLELPR
jgi:hypothetical protein